MAGHRRSRGWLRRCASALLSGALAAALLPASGCERGQAGDGPPVDAALAARRDAAARRGIEWLVGRKQTMDAIWAFSIFSYLYRIVPDADLAQTFRGILDETSRAPFVALPERFDDPALLRPPKLRPILAELRRRKWAGEPHAQASAGLEALLRLHSDDFWGDLGSLQQTIMLGAFEEIGIEPQRSLQDVVLGLRATWARGDPESLLLDVPFMLALTHVVYAASGTFTRHPDPAPLAPEVAILHRALRRYLTGPLPESRVFLDVQAEVLSVLKLLRRPEDADMRAMSERLLELQHPDGSWGEDIENHAYHATEAAVEALLDLPPAFRR